MQLSWRVPLIVMVRCSSPNPVRRGTLQRCPPNRVSAIHLRAFTAASGTARALALAALALAWSAGHVLSSPGGLELYERGRAAFLSGDYPKAVEWLEAAVAADPDHLGHRLLLARSYEFGGRPDQAEAAFLEIVRRQPEHREAALALARRHFDRQAYAGVVEVLRPQRADVDDCEVYHLLDTGLYHEGRLEEARRNLTRALALDGSHAGDRRLLGDIYLAQEKNALAVEAYETAARLVPGDASLHFKLATAFFGLRNYLGDVTRQVIDGGKPGTLCDRGYLIDSVPGERDAFYISPPRSSVYHAQKALDLGADGPEVRLLLADIWLEARRYDRAMAEYRDIKARVPHTRLAAFYYNYARASWGVGDPEGHLTRLKKAAELDRASYAPFLKPAHERVAEYYNQEGDSQKYIEHLGLAVRRAPESSELHYRLGNALWEADRRAEAVRHWRITLELRHDHPDRDRLLQLIRTSRTPYDR